MVIARSLGLQESPALRRCGMVSEKRRVPVGAGKAFAPQLERPMLWGNNIWVVEGVPSPEPPERAEDPLRHYMAVVRLARLGEPVVLPASLSGESLIEGDSNFLLLTSTQPLKLSVTLGAAVVDVEVSLHANEAGRLAGLLVDVPAVRSPGTAYRAARTIFNGLQMQLAFEQDMSIREGAIAVWGLDDQTFIMRAAIGYPNLQLGEAEGVSPIMQRLVGPYADAVNSNSPHYSFMVFFSLVEFLTGVWAGAVRTAFEARGLPFPKRERKLLFDELHEVAPYAFGKTVAEILKTMRQHRNRTGVAHFDFSVGPRLLNVRADDEVAAYRDILRLVAKNMLREAREDIRTLLGHGASEAALTSELQAFFDSHDGHKKQKKKQGRKK